MLSLRQWKINRITKKIKSMKLNRVNNQPNDEILKREILYYFELAAFYKKNMHCKKHPYAHLMMLECYRGAAVLDDSSAHFQLGQIFLDKAKYRQALEQGQVFDSPANLAAAAQLFKDALIHLLAAEQLGHIGAKRLRGLCLINGWGVVEDKNAGFDLVVASIEQEGSWDKIPQIFAAIGLNKPEFFTAIMQRKKDM